MKVYSYKPHEMRDDEDRPLFRNTKGVIEVEVMTYRERLEHVRKLGMGNMKDEDLLEKTDEIFGLVAKRVRSVDLKINGEPVNDLDELGYYEEGTSVVNNMFSVLMKGIPPLGETSRRRSATR